MYINVYNIHVCIRMWCFPTSLFAVRSVLLKQELEKNPQRVADCVLLLFCSDTQKTCKCRCHWFCLWRQVRRLCIKRLKMFYLSLRALSPKQGFEMHVHIEDFIEHALLKTRRNTGVQCIGILWFRVNVFLSVCVLSPWLWRRAVWIS